MTSDGEVSQFSIFRDPKQKSPRSTDHEHCGVFLFLLFLFCLSVLNEIISVSPERAGKGREPIRPLRRWLRRGGFHDASLDIQPLSVRKFKILFFSTLSK